MKKLISKCCGAELKVNEDSFIPLYQCSKCGICCDIIEQPKDGIKFSKCCKSLAYLTGNEPNKYYMCSSCHKSCDTIEPKEEKEEVKESHFKCPDCGTLVHCSKDAWCPKCNKLIDFETCEIVDKTPTSNEWIEEEARELSECCDVMPETLSKHQRIVYNAVLDALTQQKEAIEKEWREKALSDLLIKLQKRKMEVIRNGVAWNEKGRRIGNWELGYDDAEFDAEEIIKQLLK
jgi:hypothetical protein